MVIIGTKAHGMTNRKKAMSIRSLTVVLFFCWAARLTISAPLTDQTPATSQFLGVVVDGTGNRLPGAVVSLTVGAVEFRTVTDSQGRYTLSSLPAGLHILHATMAGFCRYEKQVDLQPGVSVVLDITLNPGPPAYIDWIAPPPDIADLIKRADAVVYVRVIANDARGSVDDTAVGLTAVVLELVKASGTQSIGNKLTFWQEQWREEPTPYPIGTHLVLFLQEWKGRLIRTHGPYAAFNVHNGKLMLSKFLYVYRKYEGMRVQEFLQQLRAKQP